MGDRRPYNESRCLSESAGVRKRDGDDDDDDQEAKSELRFSALVVCGRRCDSCSSAREALAGCTLRVSAHTHTLPGKSTTSRTWCGGLDRPNAEIRSLEREICLGVRRGGKGEASFFARSVQRK